MAQSFDPAPAPASVAVRRKERRSSATALAIQLVRERTLRQQALAAGTLMSQVHVLCRLRGEPVPLLSSEQLSAYLGSCGGLLERLVAEWYEEEEAPGKKRQLKPPYQQQKSGRKK